MKVHGLEIEEGGRVKNLGMPTGEVWPDTPNPGEFFYKTGASEGVYVYTNGVWSKLPRSSDGDFLATALLNAINGVAPLDANALLPAGKLPIATATTLGGVKIVGPGIKIDAATGAIRGSTNHAHGVFTAMTGTTNMPDTPSVTDGTEFCAVSITPKRINSKIDIRIDVQVGTTGAVGGAAISVWRNNTTLIGGGVMFGHNHGGGQSAQCPIGLHILDAVQEIDVPVTYNFRVGCYQSSNWYLGRSVASDWGGVIAASNTVFLQEMVH